MTNQYKIETFFSLKELYEYSGLNRESVFEDFDVFTLSETYPNTKKMLPPHRRNFFTILFFENQEEGQLQINANKHIGLQNAILFQSPESIFSFVRGKKMEGFIILFKASFLLSFTDDVLKKYNFFNGLQNNLFHLNHKENIEFVKLINNLIDEKANKNIAKHLLLALLEKSNMLHEQYTQEEKFIPKSFQIVRQFQQQINNHFLQNKSVKFYAKLLHITPNHLNETIKNQTGKTAKMHISERVLLEAKKLLLYSNMDIAAISYLLDFSEPSHFGAFFKKETNVTPTQYRQDHDF